MQPWVEAALAAMGQSYSDHWIVGWPRTTRLFAHGLSGVATLLVFTPDALLIATQPGRRDAEAPAFARVEASRCRDFALYAGVTHFDLWFRLDERKQHYQLPMPQMLAQLQPLLADGFYGRLPKRKKG